MKTKLLLLTALIGLVGALPPPIYRADYNPFDHFIGTSNSVIDGVRHMTITVEVAQTFLDKEYARDPALVPCIVFTQDRVLPDKGLRNGSSFELAPIKDEPKQKDGYLYFRVILPEDYVFRVVVLQSLLFDMRRPKDISYKVYRDII